MSDGARQLIDAIPLFSGIERAGLEGILRIFRPVSIAAAAPLVRQGQSADGAYIIESGSADVITALPGGGEATVASLGPGSVLGEMALLESGTRSATVIATAPVKAYFVERDSFRMLLAQREQAAFMIQNRITQTLCRRVREMNERISASSPSRNVVLPLSGQTAGPESLRRGRCSFDYRAFLPLLPVFKRFSADDLAEFIGKTELLELGRVAFDALFAGRDPVAARFKDEINRELLQALARTNNHLTRLISQARIRGGRQEKKKVEELQRALGAQDVRARDEGGG